MYIELFASHSVYLILTSKFFIYNSVLPFENDQYTEITF